MLSLLLLLFLSRLLGILAQRVGIHPLIGEVLGGLILSPLILDLVVITTPLDVFSQFAIIMVMLYSGLTTEYKSYTAHRGESILIAVGGVVVSFLLIYYVTRFLLGFSQITSLFMGAILSNTAIEVSAGVLRKSGEDDVTSVVMGASFADDVLAVVVLGIVTSLALSPGEGLSEVEGVKVLLITLAKVLIFLAATFFILSKALPRIFDRFLKGSEKVLFTITFLLTFLLAILARYVELHEVIGAYLAGLILARWRSHPDPMLKRTVYWGRINETTENMITALFSPIFFGYMGILLGDELNSISLGGPAFSRFIIVIIVIASMAVVGKLFGCGIVAYLTGFTKRDSVKIGGVMVGRGALELVLISYGFSRGFLDPVQSAAVITVTLLTVFIAPLLYTRFTRE